MISTRTVFAVKLGISSGPVCEHSLTSRVQNQHFREVMFMSFGIYTITYKKSHHHRVSNILFSLR